MKNFEKQMKQTKNEWKQKNKNLKIEKVKWEWKNNDEEEFDGMYKGELEYGKPHGYGKWKENE